MHPAAISQLCPTKFELEQPLSLRTGETRTARARFTCDDRFENRACRVDAVRQPQRRRQQQRQRQPCSSSLSSSRVLATSIRLVTFSSCGDELGAELGCFDSATPAKGSYRADTVAAGRQPDAAAQRGLYRRRPAPSPTDTDTVAD